MIKILFLSANPVNTKPLKLNEEINAIEEELNKSKFRDKFDLEQRHSVKVGTLQYHLLQINPDIVHFSGHGSRAGRLYLENEKGKNHPVGVRALSNLFSILKNNIRCVVLNACYSQIQAKTISRTIDCVICMSKAIGDKAAIEFAKGFYQGIGWGKDLETAYKLGCNRIDLENLNEQDTPKILWKNNEKKDIVLIENINTKMGIPFPKSKQMSKFRAKCNDTIELFKAYIDNPNLSNDKKAWKCFKEFIDIIEPISQDGLQKEYEELTELSSKLEEYRKCRNQYRMAGLDTLAENFVENIKNTYGKLVKIIKKIRKKLSQLGG